MATREERQPVRAPDASVNGTSKTPITVLLFEGDQRLAQATKQALEQDGFIVDVCRTAREGIDRLFQRDYSAYVINARLPDLRGAETFRRIHTLKPGSVAIMLAGKDAETAIVEIMKLGAYYVRTSTDLSHLSALSLTLHEGLDRRRVRGERDQLQTELWEHARLLEERNAELRRKEQERKRVEAVQSEFVSTVSHELRTPLATLKEFTSLLSDQLAGPVTPEQQNYLSIMRTNVERLSWIIDELLSMATMEAGRLVLTKEMVEAAALAGQVIASLQPLANNKRITLALEAPKPLPPVFADPDKITQVLVNFLGNAIKFMKEGGRATVTITERPNDVEFCVTDTGPGIAPEDVPKLFEKFQQLRSGDGKPQAHGTGLGLAISKQLVELHGGRIGVTSASGHGSVFFFTLPKYNVEELLHEYLNAGIAEAKRRQRHFSVIVVSIANFQKFKSLHGSGDASRVLRELEATLTEGIRRGARDIVARWHKGEMVVILAETSQAVAATMAARFKQVAEAHAFSIGAKLVTVPIATATATYPDDGLTEEHLLRLIEQRLQRVNAPQTRIMVIDDEPKIRQFLKETLELREYDVLTAASGPDALEQLKRYRVDLVLLDLMMPVMDGYEVYHLLRETPETKDVPVIIITAKGERKDRQLGLESATYNYLLKPFQIEDLFAKVREVLQHRGARSTGSRGGRSHG